MQRTPRLRAPPRRGPPHRWAILLLLLASFLPYLNSLWGEFHFDDDQFVQNENLTSLKDLTATCPRGRTLAFITFYANARLNGLESMPGWHLVNILLHAGCVLSAYWLFTLLAGQASAAAPGARSASSRRRTANGREASAPPGDSVAPRALWPLLAAALLAVHPLASEPVNYIIARTCLLYAGFTLLALCGMILLERTRDLRGKLAAAVMVCCCVALAALSKEVGAFTAIAAVLLYLLTAGHRMRREHRKGILATVVFVAAAALIWLKVSGEFEPIARRVETAWFSSHLCAQLIIFWRYLLLAALPLPGWLTVDHYVPTRPYAIGDGDVLLAAMGLMTLIAAGLLLIRWRPITALLLLFIPGVLAPYFVMTSQEMMVEYRFYLPLVAFCGLAAMAAERLSSARLARPRLLITAAPAILITLATLTCYRNTAWRTDLSLWEDACAKAPQKARTVSGLAWALVKDTTAPDPQRGLELALRSLDPKRVDLPPGFNPFMVDTLAEAYFANEEYDQATKLERDIIRRGWRDPYFAKQLARFEDAEITLASRR